MAENWAEDVKKYVKDADEDLIAAIVRYCGIALRNRDSSLVAFSDKTELARVRNNFLKKKLGLTEPDDQLDAAIAAVGKKMKGDSSKNRVTVYYLLLDQLGAHGRLTKAKPKAAPKAVAAKPAKAGAAVAATAAVASDAAGKVAAAGGAVVGAAGDAALATADKAGTAALGAAAALTGGLSSGVQSLTAKSDDDDNSGLGWLWWVLLALLAAFLIWWVFLRG